MNSEILQWFDPCTVFEAAGMIADAWQELFLRSASKRVIALTTRQCGKSTTAAALCIHKVITTPETLVILLSPTERQSKEIFKKAIQFYRYLGKPIPAEVQNKTSLELVNGSRIVALPSNEEGIRGYSGAKLIIIDEASRVMDDLYYSILPMLATSNGTLIALSTPFGKRGWFFEEWERLEGWEKTTVTADECPRIPKEHLEEMKLTMGKRWFNQEYFCVFQDAVDAVFREEDIHRAFQHGIRPILGL